MTDTAASLLKTMIKDALEDCTDIELLDLIYKLIECDKKTTDTENTASV